MNDAESFISSVFRPHRADESITAGCIAALPWRRGADFCLFHPVRSHLRAAGISFVAMGKLCS